MAATLNPGEEAQLTQTIEMFETITQSQPQDYQSLEILKEAYLKLGQPEQAVKTSKRIAHAYVQLGQLSSAILEYETILQRDADDKDALAAMAEIESKANSLTAGSSSMEQDSSRSSDNAGKKIAANVAAKTDTIDDGRQMMRKIFVDSKLISAGDFEMCWTTPSLTEAPEKICDPFIQLLAEKGITQIDKSLRLILDRSRLGYLLLEKYDVDMELARSFPRDTCQRWCVLPFDRMSKSIMVATANPFNKQAALELQKATTSRIIWYIVPPLDIAKVLRKVFR
jgi:tetratricopeptide (TPR) repeat protein